MSSRAEQAGRGGALSESARDAALLLAVAVAAALWATLAVARHFDEPLGGDSLRYDHAARRLVALWQAGAPSGSLLGDLALRLPFSPSGEKPFFVYAIAVVRACLSIVAPVHKGDAVFVLDAVSILGIAAVVCLAARRAGGRAVAFLGFVLVLLDYDLFLHARAGLHTAFGLVLFAAGIQVNASFRTPARSLAAGVLHGLSVFASLNVALPTAAWYASGWLLGARPSWKRGVLPLTAGALAVIGGSLAVNALQARAGVPVLGALDTLVWEQAQARFFGARLPYGFDYGLDYLLFQTGYAYGAVVVGVAAFVLWRWFERDRAAGADRTGAQAVITAGLVYVAYAALHLPAIGRGYSPVLLLLLMAVPAGVAILRRQDTRALRLSALPVAAASALLALVAFAGHVAARAQAARDGTHAPFADARTFDARTVDGPAFRNDPGLPERLRGKIVRVHPEDRFTHSAMTECELDMALSSMVARGLKPVAVVAGQGPDEGRFMNETSYFAFHLGRWREVLGEYGYLANLPPGRTYYFDGDDVAGQLAGMDRRQVVCPRRDIYVPRSLPSPSPEARPPLPSRPAGRKAAAAAAHSSMQ